MKRTLQAGLLALLVTNAGHVRAHETVSLAEVFADVGLYRPVGLALTALGAGLFAAMSPALLIANQAPPHHAFDDTAEALVMTPYRFTFERPIGALRPGPNGVYQRR